MSLPLAAPLSAQCFDERGAWTDVAGVATISESFGDFQSDISFEAGPVPIRMGAIQAVNGLNVRNFVDVPPFQSVEHDGTPHAACYVNDDTNTQIQLTFRQPVKAFGCDISGGLGQEGVELLILDSNQTAPIAICAIASDSLAQFVGYASDDSFRGARLRSMSLVPGLVGETFGLDDLAVVTEAQCFDQRPQWAAAAGATNTTPGGTESFAGFNADTPFSGAPVALNIGSIQSFQGQLFENLIDVPPFQTMDNNGTNYASCYVNHAEDGVPQTRIEIRFDRPVRAFGAEITHGLGLEGVQLTFFKGNAVVIECPISSDDAGQFLGVVSPDPMERVVFTAMSLIPGSGGEGFGLDNLVALECAPIGGPSPTPCPTTPNSTGLPGEARACGSTSIGHNDVTLLAGQLPVDQFGYFLASRNGGIFMPPGSAGFICLGPNIGRYQDSVGQGPCFSTRIDVNAIPVNPVQAVIPGERWRFQAWYRDGQTSNFTDVVVIQFTP
ncbi:MAG: hypothetical protein GY711_26885 [bacterium]|nr:hypothetical protein [bacterium]